MRRFYSLLLLALVLLSVPITLAQENTPAPDLTFQLIDSDPADGLELTGEQVILYFDRPVDCATAESALSLSPAVAGAVTCNDEDASMTFTPSEALPAATAYTLTVADTLRAQDGARLAEPVSLEFQSTGALAVTSVLPVDDSTAVEAESIITVIFNRPVVPLVIAEEQDDLSDPLVIEPAVEGEGQWLNTSIYVFTPDPALAGGTEYTVTVPAGLEAIDGAVLPADYSWSFTTIDPAISTVFPEDGAASVELDEDIQIAFNQPMDRESVESAFQLVNADNGEPVPGTFEWAEDSAGFRFDPDDELTLDTAYDIRFGEGARGASGSATLVGQTTFNFVTVPFPAIVQTSPSDGSVEVSVYSSFTIYFASPMDRDTLDDKITIEPEPWREFDSYYNDYDNSYSLNFPVEPSTDYTVTIDPGMRDLYGNEITTTTVVEFSTEAYDPDVMLQTAGSYGFYNAYNDETRLFLTHRNVSRVELDLYGVPLDRFGRLLTSDNYFGGSDNFQPDPANLIRSWQIESDTPENQRRYELLSLGGEAGDPAASCEDAPPSRLKVGDTAMVVTEPDGLRARESAPDGAIVTLLYRDYVLEITGGPVCANGLLWWEVALRDGQTAWVAEGDSEEYFLDLRSAAQTTEVNLREAVGEDALPPGIYMLQVNAPELRELGYTPSRHFMVVGTANLTMKASFDNVVIWATDVNTGAPLAGAPITVYDENYAVIGSGTTDAEGLVTIATPLVNDLYVPRLVILDDGGQFGLTTTNWTQGIEPYMFGQNYQSTREPYRGYLYTDRPVYRPGQPVYFRGVIRSRDDVTYTQPDFDSVPVAIYNESGDVVYEATLPLTPFGTFSDTFEISPDAGLGYYRIETTLPELGGNAYYYNYAIVGFNVAEYRLPEFQVNLTAAQEAVVQGDTVQVQVNSTYYFGGAVSDSNVEYNVVSQPYFFEYDGPGYYSFIDFDYDGGPSEFFGGGGGAIASGTVTTDAQGNAVIEFRADLEDATQSQIFTIEAVVTDESGQGVAGRTDVIVHKGLIYVGVSPREYVATAEQETTVDLLTVDWDSDAVSGQTVEVDVVERRWSNVQEEDEAGRTIWTWEVEEIPVTSGSVTTDADGRAEFTFMPPNGGIFKITATTRDSEGNEVVASQTLWVSSREYVSWRQQNSNRIDLVVDSDDYEVGDTAQILIASPFQGTAEALITVERGDVLSVERVTLESNSYVYELPITADFEPNVYVSVFIVKGVDENNPVAAFRMGMVQIAVGNERKEVQIEITPNVEQAGPGDTVTYTVRTTNFDGDPVTAEVGVALTDLASLAIGDPNSAPILGYFYGQQGVSVLTATPLTINVDQITQTVLDTIKGGGGGFGEGGIFDIREEFVDTAYWNATLVTENGEATFEVTLPDNLTTWRLDARAVTSGEDGLTLVGQDTFDLLSTKPLLIRPVTPRFFVVGDEVTLAAVVNNNTDSDQDVQVALEATGVTFLGDEMQALTIPAGGRARIEWPVTVDEVETIDLTFFANGNNGEYTDASKPPLGQGDDRLLPVLRYEAPETVGTGGVLREGGSVTESVALPRAFDVTQGELTVQIEPSLAATTLDGLDYLRNYPYQCTEQTVSRFLPNVMTYRALEQFDLTNPTLEGNLIAAVEFGLQRLYAEQHVDGGWGWFVQDRSNALTTAYALIGLSEAAEQGFTISSGVISAAQDFLSSQLIVPDLSRQTWELNRQAFVLYALARSGAPDAARTETLYENRDRLSYYAKAFLALTLNMINPDDSRTDTLMSDLINGAVLSATGAHWQEEVRDVWNWNTDTRTTAVVLDALVKLAPDNDLIPNVVRWLMVARTADAWETTQETAWAVMALTDWMVATGELNPAYDFEAAVNGDTLAEGTATRANVTEATELVVQVADLLQDQANEVVISRTDGDGVLYYTAHLTTYLPVSEIEPLNRGIILERRYTMLGDESETPITEARVGDVVQVRLTIIVPNDLHYAVIEDPIPAGTDAVNPDLATSQQVGTQPELNPNDPLSQGWGWWWFTNTEFRDEKVVLFATYLPAGTYEYVYSIRAGLPGTYNVIPTTGQEFYFPEVYGRAAGSMFTILPE